MTTLRLSKKSGPKLITLKSKHLKAIFICLMGLPGGHLVEGYNLSK
jgi:hypothetical protein